MEIGVQDNIISVSSLGSEDDMFEFQPQMNLGKLNLNEKKSKKKKQNFDLVTELKPKPI